MAMDSTTQAERTLTAENAREGLLIERTAHPEWGTHRLSRDRNGWVKSNERSSSMLDEGEFCFWQIANR